MKFLSFYNNYIELIGGVNSQIDRDMENINDNDLKKENINNIPEIISSVIKNAID